MPVLSRIRRARTTLGNSACTATQRNVVTSTRRHFDRMSILCEVGCTSAGEREWSTPPLEPRSIFGKHPPSKILKSHHSTPTHTPGRCRACSYSFASTRTGRTRSRPTQQQQKGARGGHSCGKVCITLKGELHSLAVGFRATDHRQMMMPESRQHSS